MRQAVDAGRARPDAQGGGTRRWRARLLLAVLLPAAALALLEGGLRLAGYGHPTGFFLPRDAHGLSAVNPRFGWRFFPRTLARDPWPAALAPKPPGAVRIFVLGSSAAMGTPDPSYSFGRILEVLLRERHPAARIEVVNAAMVAINSHAVREIARDCAAQAPDLFVVYEGNNEVIGPFGPGSVLRPWTPSLPWVRFGLRARTLRAGQLLAAAAERLRPAPVATAGWRGLEMFLDNPVAADDPRLETTYAGFRRNLADVCAIGRGAGAGVVLCTVAVNLRDCPPFASQHRADLAPGARAAWDETFRAGAALESQARWPEALAAYAAATALDDRHAELAYRTGRCLLATGRGPEARAAFERARDLDALRFRADTRINAAIREVARDARGVALVDAEHAVGDRQWDGDDASLFYEHVHLTFAGNYRLARSVLDAAERALPQLGTAAAEAPSEERCAQRLALTPWDAQRLAGDMAALTARPPFTGQADHDADQARRERRRDALMEAGVTPAALEDAGRTYTAAVAATPGDWNVRHHFAMLATACGRPDVAATQLREAIRLLPTEALLHTDLGCALAAQGRLDAAVAEHGAALRLNPDYAEALHNLGNALMAQGHTESALARFRAALARRPDFVQTRVSLGNAMARLGRSDEAVAWFNEALTIQPGCAEALNNLGLLLAGAGRTDEAILRYREAIRAAPRYVDARYNLALALAGRGETEAAIGELRLALELEPRHAAAHNNLAALLAGAGRLQEAIDHFRAAAELDPGNPNYPRNLAAAQAELGRATP